MSTFENVSVIKKANIYYDGNVTSRAVIFDNGESKTLGIMLPGNYEFATEKKEIMEILAGELSVLLPLEEKWLDIKAPFTFEVPAASKFKLNIKTVTDYCCSYIDA
jgi:hypothetical protein